MAERYWISIPAFLRRYSLLLSAAWSDGFYLSAWPSLAPFLPVLLFLAGMWQGAAHWGVLVVGDSQVLAHFPVVTFAQVLPFLGLAAIAGALSSNFGLMLTLGYAVGDFFISGPLFRWNSTPIDQFLHLRVPQLVSYLLLFLLSVQPSLTGQMLTRSFRWLARRTGMASTVATVILQALLQGVLVWGWTLAAPMVVRTIWSWAWLPPPITLFYYAAVTNPWLPILALAAALLRGFLTLRAARHDGFVRIAVGLARGCEEADRRKGWTREIPAAARAIFSALLMTGLIGGFIGTMKLGIFIWAVTAAVLMAYVTLLPSIGVWNGWASAAQKVPLLIRWLAAMAGGYFLTHWVLSLPGHAAQINNLPGAFKAELESLGLGLLLSLLLLPNAPKAVRAAGSATGPVAPALAGLVALMLLTAGTAHAVCLDPLCCFGNNLTAALAVLGLLMMLPALFLLGPMAFAGLLLDLLAAKGVMEAAIGRDLLTGQDLSLTERALDLLGVKIPGLGKLARGAADLVGLKRAETAVTSLEQVLGPMGRFGANDLVYGPSAQGALEKLAADNGGRILTSIPNTEVKTIRQLSLDTLADAASSGQQVHFDLTNMQDIPGVLAGTAYTKEVTSAELRYIRDNWSSFTVKPKFYRNGYEVAPPW